MREMLLYHVLPGVETVENLSVNNKLWTTLDGDLQVRVEHYRY